MNILFQMVVLNKYALPTARMVGTHLHLASGMDSIFHQAKLVLPAMVHPIFLGVTGSIGILKVVRTEGLRKTSI